MANNYLQPGDTVTAIAPAGGTTTGVGVLIGDLFGIAATTEVATAEVELHITGVFTMPKTTALQIDAGDVVYWDDTGKEVDKTAAAQKAVGICITDAANPSDTCEVRLVPNITAA
ncbi:MAG: DUF2190 family protein [Geminicoccaceae bacterium]